VHDAAYTYVATVVADHALTPVTVLDLGGRNVNGTTRALFPTATRYLVVDIADHPSVDVVADAGDLDLGQTFDVVVSTELLEHTNRAADIVAAAYRHLDVDGTFVATMAGPGRGAHGASGEAAPPPGEWYRNVEPDELVDWLTDAGFEHWSVNIDGADLRCWAKR